eukprot:Em0006g569a
MMAIETFVLALIASAAVLQSGWSQSIFGLSPSNATVCQGDIAIFNCSSSNTIEFVINGIRALDFIANQSDQYSTYSSSRMGNANFGTLYMIGAPKYDQIVITCRAFLMSGSSTESLTAVLRVLSSPSNLSVSAPGNGTLVLNWTLPSYPSSQLYAVEVRNQSSAVLYTNTTTTPGIIPALGCLNYTISVASLCATSKGTPTVYTFSASLGPGNIAVAYGALQNCTILSDDVSCFEIQIFVNCAFPSYTLTIPSENIAIIGMYSPTVKGSILFSTALPRGRKYDGLLTSQDLSTFNVTISTFEIQKMTASISDSGFLVSCVFASGSRAKGCLLLVIGTSSEQYSVIRRYGLTTSANQTLTGLAPGYYSLKSYDIYEDGNLSSVAASEITGFQVPPTGTPATPGYSDIDSIGTNLYTSPNGLAICMYCALRKASTIKGCAFVARQLHVLGTSTVTLRTAVHQGTTCFNSASSGNYTVAVFDWEADGIIGRGPFMFREFQLAYVTPIPTPTRVSAGAGVLIVILVALMILGIVYHKRKRVGFAVTHDDVEKKEDLSKQKATGIVYEDLPGKNAIDTRIPPAVPPPRTTSDRSLNLRINSQVEEMVDLMTVSSSRSSETTERTDVSSPVSMCHSETSLVSQRTEPQYQVIPETSNLFLLKTSSVSLQSSASLRPQPKVSQRALKAYTVHAPTNIST